MTLRSAPVKLLAKTGQDLLELGIGSLAILVTEGVQQTMKHLMHGTTW